MKEDCPKYILEKRKELQEQLKLEREKGNTAIANCVFIQTSGVSNFILLRLRHFCK